MMMSENNNMNLINSIYVNHSERDELHHQIILLLLKFGTQEELTIMLRKNIRDTRGGHTHHISFTGTLLLL